MDAPKCRTCGKIEWHHVCAAPLPVVAVGTRDELRKKDSKRKLPQANAANAANEERSAGRTGGVSRASRGADTPALLPSVPTEPPVFQPRGRGRPKRHPDRKAYKAQKERERRAKLKEGK